MDRLPQATHFLLTYERDGGLWLLPLPPRALDTLTLTQDDCPWRGTRLGGDTEENLQSQSASSCPPVPSPPFPAERRRADTSVRGRHGDLTDRKQANRFGRRSMNTSLL